MDILAWTEHGDASLEDDITIQMEESTESVEDEMSLVGEPTPENDDDLPLLEGSSELEEVPTPLITKPITEGDGTSTQRPPADAAPRPNDPVYARMGDAAVHPFDLATVQDPYSWLSDSAIYFWQQWVLHEKVVRDSPFRVYMMAPATATLYHQIYLATAADPEAQAKSLVDLAAENPDLLNHHWIMVPVCDGDGGTAAGEAGTGTHWSLLLFDLMHGEVWYADSLNDANALVARQMWKMMEILTRIEFDPDDILAPQQRNFCDCGVFVCWIITVLVEEYVVPGRDLSRQALMPFWDEIDDTIMWRRNIVEAMGYCRDGARVEVIDNEIVEDEVVGHEVVGDEVVGDEVVGDEVVGDEVVGDNAVGDKAEGDEVGGDELVREDFVGDKLVEYHDAGNEDVGVEDTGNDDGEHADIGKADNGIADLKPTD